MKFRPLSGTAAGRRSRVLAAIAFAIGSVVLLARHLDDWTRKPGDTASLATVVAQPLQRLEWWVYDFVHTYGRKTPSDPEVVVLGIDEATLDLENASSAFPEDIEASRPLQLMNRLFPWSREVYAHVIDKLLAAGAKTVVVDLLMPAANEEFPEGDALFRDCLERHAGRVVLGAELAARQVGQGVSDTVHFPHQGLIEHGWPVDDRIGLAMYATDDDGVIRRTSFLRQLDARLPERQIHTFAATTLRSQGLADRVPPGTDAWYVRFGDLIDYEPVSLHEIFVPALWEQNYGNGSFFAGRTVFLGPVARQQQDFHPTPLGVTAGVRIHAHVFAATKAGELLDELPPWANTVLLVCGSFLAWALVTFGRRPTLVAALLLGGLGMAVVGQLLLFNHARLVAHVSTPLLAYGLIGFVGFSYDFLLERRQKLALKRSVMRFHSPDVAEEIVQHPEYYYNIREGANRTIVILFSDIRGYTSMSEVLTAQQMVAQLNEYFERMVAIVFQREGAVDKFIGDAMMAVWGRFRNNPREYDLVQDACSAVDSALAMRAALAELNIGWRQRDITELAIGIGLHQGDAVVGEIGSHERAELTAIGDCVNLGSRLEGATKEYGLDLLISEALHQRVASHFRCRSVDLLRVKGKRQPVEVFTVLGPADQPPPPGLEHFEEGMRAYRAGHFAHARLHFEHAAAAGLADELTSIFHKRCAELNLDPPENWDGVYTLTKK
jgi:adenylate cyclase